MYYLISFMIFILNMPLSVITVSEPSVLDLFLTLYIIFWCQKIKIHLCKLMFHCFRQNFLWISFLVSICLNIKDHVLVNISNNNFAIIAPFFILWAISIFDIFIFVDVNLQIIIKGINAVFTIFVGYISNLHHFPPTILLQCIPFYPGFDPIFIILLSRLFSFSSSLFSWVVLLFFFSYSSNLWDMSWADSVCLNLVLNELSLVSSSAALFEIFSNLSSFCSSPLMHRLDIISTSSGSLLF